MSLLLAACFALTVRAGTDPNPVAGDTEGLGRYRTDHPEPRVREVPEELARLVRERPREGVPRLAAFLVEGTDDPFLQVKRLHDWVALNLSYDLEGLRSGGGEVARGAEGALGSGKAVCGGFAAVYELLARHAGFELATIEGYGRGLGFEPFGDEPVGRSTHAWSAVEIEGAWYLLDPTWDAGTVEGGSWLRRYSTDYLFLDPVDFVVSHFPEEPAWQLLEEPLDAGAFQAQPFAKGGFHRLGLAWAGPVARMQSVASEAAVRIDVPPGLQLNSRLETPEGQVVPGATLERWDRDEATVLVRFPESGAFELLLFAGPIEHRSTWSVADLGFVASEGSEGGFPRTFGAYEKGRAALLEPLELPGEPGLVRFSVRVPDVHAVAVASGEGPWHELQVRRGDRWVGRVPVEPGVRVAINAQRNPGDRDWDTLVVWETSSD